MKLLNWLRDIIFGKDKFLCDTCKYDYRGACNNPDKPNAKECSDYKNRAKGTNLVTS